MRTVLAAVAGFALIAVVAVVKERREADSEVLAMMKARRNLYQGRPPVRESRSRRG